MFNRNCMRQMPMMTMPGQESLIDIDNNNGNIDIDQSLYYYKAK